MKIFPISDMHANFIDVYRYSDQSPFNINFLKKIYSGTLGDGSDTVMLACGDMSERYCGVLLCERFLQAFPKLQICYCPGNHEFYGANYDLLLHDFRYADSTSDRLHILDGVYNCKVVINNELTVVGGTLWTDFNKGNDDIMNLAQKSMNDYNYIFSGNQNKKITTNRILQIHYETRKNMFWHIVRADKNIPLVCMSHHTPYAGIPKNGFHWMYHTDLSEKFNELSRVPMYWFSGHTHQSEVHRETYNAGEVQFISNQVGYPHQLDTGFSLNCIMEV